MAVVESFLANNHGIDLLHFDFTNQAHVSGLKLGSGAEFTEAKAMQRVLRVASGLAQAAVLIAHGFDSANRIAAMPRGVFARQIGPALGDNGHRAAQAIHDRAAVVRAKTLHLTASIHASGRSGHFRALRSNPIPAAVFKTFEDIPSYEEMFQTRDFCRCDECLSIWGPAAYLTDLLRIIAERVTAANTIPAGFSFPERRPDIPNIALTCDNTDGVSPYLSLTNDILSVHAGPDPLRTAATSVFPYNLPFNQPLAWLRRLVGLRSLDLAGLRRTFSPGGTSAALAGEILNLSVSEQTNLAPVADADLAKRLAANFGVAVTATSLAGLDQVPTFQRQTGMGPETLAMILNQGLGAQELMNLDGLAWNLGDEGALTLAQDGAGVTGRFGPQQPNGTLAGSLVGNVLAGSCRLSKDPKDGGKASTGFFSVTIDWITGAIAGSRWITSEDKTITVAWAGAVTVGKFSAGVIPHQLFFNTGLAGSAFLHIVSRQSASDAIAGLDLKSLDRLNRLIRLSSRSGWSAADLTWLMISLGITDIDAGGLAKLATVARLQSLQLAPSDLAALWFDIKTIGIGPETVSAAPFDVLFNAPKRLRQSAGLGTYRPQGGTGFQNPLYAHAPLPWIVQADSEGLAASAKRLGVDPAQAAQATAIVACIPLGREDLSALAEALFPASKGSFLLLDLGTLSALYRHAILARALELPLADHLTLLRLLGVVDGEHVRRILQPEVVERIVGFVGAMNAAGVAVADLAWICAGTPSNAAPVGFDGAALAAFRTALSPAMAASLLSPAMLQSPSMTLDQASQVWRLLLNDGALNNLGAVLVDVSGVEIAPKAIKPPLDPQQRAYVIDSLARARAGQDQQLASQIATFLGAKDRDVEVLMTGLSALLARPDPADLFLLTEILNVASSAVVGGDGSLDPDKVATALAGQITITGKLQIVVQSTSAWIVLAADGQAIVAYARSDGANVHFYLAAAAWPPKAQAPVPDTVQQLMRHLARQLWLVNLLSLSADEIAGLFQAPAAISGAAWQNAAPTPDGVLGIARFKALVRSFNDSTGQLLGYLLASGRKGADPLALEATLSAITGWDPNGLKVALRRLCNGGPCTNIVQLQQLADVFGATAALGVNATFIFDLLDSIAQPANADHWNAYVQAVETLTGAIQGQLGADVWASRYRDVESQVLGASRDALVPMVINRLAMPSVTSARQLSEFLMMDVDMSGCADISPIKLALNSCQLYLQRCRLNLEPGVAISSDDIPDSWWEWIMEYRVWQANREVFVYPENYLDPSVRHTKSRLFKDLENSLAQGASTAASVEAAFTRYLDGFATLAKLEYVAGIHAITHDPELGPLDTLYLFARTPTEPPTYYYIVRQPGDVWGEWIKIELSINADVITPVYVFSRLFLFWVELSTVEQQNTQNQKSRVSTASLKYTFHDFSGNWVQPQILVSGLVINVEAADTQYGPFTADLFDPGKPYFSRVQAIVTAPSSYAQLGGLAPPAAEITEKLTILYGPSVTVNGAPSGATITASGASGALFAAMLAATKQAWADMATAGKTGILPIFPALTIDIALDQTFLLNEGEVVLPLASPFSDTSPPAPRVAWDAVTTKLAVFDTNVALTENYVEGMGIDKVTLSSPGVASIVSFVTPDSMIDNSLSVNIYNMLQNSFHAVDSMGNVLPGAVKLTIKDLQSVQVSSGHSLTPAQARWVKNRLAQLFYGTLALFGQTARKRVAVLPVGNQPGYAIVNMSGESFLVSAPLAGLPMLDQTLTLQRPYAVINAGTFVCDYFNTTMSQTILTSLQHSGGFVTQAGVVDLQKAAFIDVDLYQTILQFDDTLRASLVKDILLRQGPSGLVYSAAADPDATIYTLPWQVDRLTTGAVDELSRALFAGGIDALLSLSSQQRPARIRLPFARLAPNGDFIRRGPSVPYGNQVDFAGPYQLYYWELFYHAPMQVARALRNNNQFADARRWLNFAFNPTTPPFAVTAESLITPDVGRSEAQVIFGKLQAAQLITKDGAVAPAATTMTVADFATAAGLDATKPEDMRAAEEVQNALVNLFLVTPTARFWQFLPLRNNTIQDLRADLQDTRAIAEYERDPFDPHAIARLRIGAYQKATVMAYLDLLVGWGDQLFTQYTWESITTATMLYMYASDLLGPAPVDVGPCSRQFPVNFNDILNRYSHVKGGIPQFLIDMEHFVQSGPVERAAAPDHPYNDLGTYFCVPENTRFVGYWDTVGDRLYKIRHCLNIQGEAQPLPLFEPPLNPMALVEAAAMGGPLDAAAYQQPTIPSYRFDLLISRAKELTGAVAGFGAALLAALEKQDAAALDMLRTTQENVLLDMTTRIRSKSIEDLSEQIASLKESITNAAYRRDYYADQIGTGLNAFELAQLDLMAIALYPQVLALGIHGISIGAYLVPNIYGLADGGMQFGDAVNAGASIADGVAAVANQSASLIGAVNEYVRRAEDWRFQRDNASSDIVRLNADLAAATARLASSQQDMANHLTSIAQGKAVETFLRGKFTNQDLYQWMLSRLSGLYYQAYQLALSAAQAAQIAYRFELDRDDTFISFGYWDSLHKGLLSGEALDISVRQMEQSYLGHNPRRLEIEKTVSLRQLFPREFQKFKWGPDGNGQGRGVLNFTLSQALFDWDFPGHYCRKIHSVVISLPALIGPYQDLHATLTQTANYVALTPDIGVTKWLVSRTVQGLSNDPVPSVAVLRQNWASQQQVVLSRGVDDGGLFVLDGNDPRYLPFEGTGAVSSWTLSLPPDTNRLNFDQISDVLVTLRYTAKDGGIDAATPVRGLYRGVSPFAWAEGKTIELAQVAPGAWQALQAVPAGNAHRRIAFTVTDPSFLVNLSAVRLLQVAVQLELADPKQTVTTTGAGQNFLSIEYSDQDKPGAFDISANVGVPALPAHAAAGQGQVWTLDFDPTKSPASLFTAADPGRLVNISVSIYFIAAPFAP